MFKKFAPVLCCCLVSFAALAAGNAGADQPVSIAVLGDSDSHAYGDRIFFPLDSQRRGGDYRRVTLQWTESLFRLRGKYVDLGPWGEWGGGLLNRFRSLAGRTSRGPAKEDYQYNFAISGAECRDLVEGNWRQVDSLLREMESDAGRWRNGIVVIQIGINSIGGREQLDRFALEGASSPVKEEVGRCVSAIESTARQVGARHPGTRVVVVGIADNMDWPPYLEFWRSSEAMRNINAVNDVFDEGLRALSRADPGRVAFLDARAWFRRHWGSRDESGMPAYREVRLPSGITVRNTQGDSLDNAILSDGHGGTVLNALFAMELVNCINSAFGMRIPEIGIEELDAYVADLRRQFGGS